MRRWRPPKASGFPLLVRPSYVLGGRAMEIVYSREGLADYLRRTVRDDGRAIFLDRFLENAIEVDVDALCDGEDVWIGGIMQHVEEAGIHSGDSACVPAAALARATRCSTRSASRHAASRSGSASSGCSTCSTRSTTAACSSSRPTRGRRGPSRSSPRRSASRWPRWPAASCSASASPTSTCPPTRCAAGHVSVKEAVLPFDRFEGADAVLGPEMRSTGEVMGIARDFPTAFAKAQAAAGRRAARRAAPRSSRSPTATSRAPSASPRRCTTSASGSSPRAAPREAIERMGIPARRRSRRSARARRTSWTGSSAATSTSWSTRRRARARAPTAGRSAARPSPAGSRA